MARTHIRWAFSAAPASLSLILVLGSKAQLRAQTPPAAPVPSPSPSVAASPAVTLGAAFTIAGFHSMPVNATGALDTAAGRDLADRSDIANLLVSVAAASSRLRASATIGSYTFATVGQALNPTLQPGANTDLYSALPLAQVTYALNDHVGIAAGKFATLLGSESLFTYQNLTIQRGLGWALEPVISRGVHATYVNGALNATLEYNDAYFSGGGRAVEALVGYSAMPGNGVQLAAIFPGRDVGPNPTSGIGNKVEYNLMYARQIGKLQLSPYVLLVMSPASAVLGYARSERASAAVALASYAFSAPLSLAVRYEEIRNQSTPYDTGSNADLVGYGPGSNARTLTVTPAWRTSSGLVRFEYSRVWLARYAAGSGFGESGKAAAQERFGFEIGLIK